MLRPALIAAILACTVSSADADSPAPLRLVQTIALPQVAGRIDHLAIDLQGQRLFVAALGNHSLEVVDLRGAKWMRSISGFREPQGVAYVPDLNRLFVSDGGTGLLSILDGASLERIQQVRFSGDADNLRYDPARKRLHVGYGDGALGEIDAATGTHLGDTQLGGHPESFQLEPSGPRIFVNVPDANRIVVVDREAHKDIAAWPMTDAHANFPMALAADVHRVFIGCRQPPKLLILDTESGKPVASLDIVADVDDVFHDAASKRVYVSGGGGFIDVFTQHDADHYTLLSRVPTRTGARTSLLVIETGRLYLAVPRHADRSAEIRVYAVLP